MRGNVRHKYFERRSQSPSNAYTDRHTCNAYADFLHPIFFISSCSSAHCVAAALVSKVRESRTAAITRCMSSGIVLIYGHDNRKFYETGVNLAVLADRRQLGTILILVGAFTALLFPAKYTRRKSSSRENESSVSRVSRALCLYASSGLVIESHRGQTPARVSLGVRPRVSKFSARARARV